MSFPPSSIDPRTDRSRVETLTVQVDVTTTTSLYPSPIKREEAELQARSIPVPPYLSTFAPYQLSSGCSCFITPLPSPTYTVVASTVITTFKHATVHPPFLPFPLASLTASDNSSSIPRNEIHHNNKHVHYNANTDHRGAELLPDKWVHYAKHLVVGRQLGIPPSFKSMRWEEAS